MKTPIKKLSTLRYSKQCKEMSLIFDLIRHSLKELTNEAFRRFIQNVRSAEIARHEKGAAYRAQHPEFDLDYVKRKHRKKLSDEFPLTPTLKWHEYKGDAYLGLNRSELIIRVALFEAFLKEIHRQTLIAKPQLLSLSKPNRPIPLKTIFREGLKRFQFDEIDRQVREADRLKTKEKARFFQRRLKLPWGHNTNLERDLVKRIDELIHLRHELVHSDYGTHVTEQDIHDARQLFQQIPETCISTAAKIYQDHFVFP
jgi:hypothetical protein